MQTDVDQISFLKKGIYKITNLKTGRWYVGSVVSSNFRLRFKRHLNLLLNGKHENLHLQRAFDKYGQENFEFKILEILETNIFEREQYYLDTYFDELYNMNPFASKPPCFSTATTETKNKSIAGRKIFNQEALIYYNQIKKSEIKIEDVPRKFHAYINRYLTVVPWNKGLTKETHDFSFLRGVKKTCSEKFLNRAKQVGLKRRTLSKKINCFLYDGSFYKQFGSITEIVEYSKNTNDLVLILSSERKKDFTLEPNNIGKVLRHKQPHHKGLIFRWEDDSSIVNPLLPRDIRFNFKTFDQCFFYKHCLLLEQSNKDNSVNSEEPYLLGDTEPSSIEI